MASDKCPKCGEVWPRGPAGWDCSGTFGDAPYPTHSPGSVVCLQRQLVALAAKEQTDGE